MLQHYFYYHIAERSSKCFFSPPRFSRKSRQTDQENVPAGTREVNIYLCPPSGLDVLKQRVVYIAAASSQAIAHCWTTLFFLEGIELGVIPT